MKIVNSLSTWVFAIIILWYVKIINFSPLLLVIVNLMLSTYFVGREYDWGVTFLSAFLIAIHAKPAYFFRHNPFAFKETFIILIIYNLFLKFQGTNVMKEYNEKYSKKPKTIKEVFEQT